MERSQSLQHLEHALKSVFDAVPKSKKSMLMRDMMYVETLARCGVEEYVNRCNQKEKDSEQTEAARPGGRYPPGPNRK